MVHPDSGGVLMADCMNVAASVVAAPRLVTSRPRHRWLFGAATLPLASALALSPALAQNFTVESPDVVGQQFMANPGGVGVIEAGGTVSTDAVPAVVMFANDQMVENFGLVVTTGSFADGIASLNPTATISNFGTISIAGSSAYGIRSEGEKATITNSGTISTMGSSGAHGIMSAGENATITNSGTISITGFGAYGIYSSGQTATISNSGTISTTGDDAHGIQVLNTATTITNTGTISTAGEDSYGIAGFSTASDVMITNAGAILTTGRNGHGIIAGGPFGTFTNSGTISTTGIEAYGIYSTRMDATLINSGTISVAGIGSVGIISVEQNATLTNSGSIISEQYDAIFLLGTNATLNLLAGTVIQGGIRFDPAAENTVSFGPGLNALMTFYDIPDTILTGDNPYAVNGTTIAVLDRGGFALSDDMALTLASDVAGMTGGPGQCVASADGSTGDDACDTEAWLAGFGGFGGRSDSSDLAGYDYASGGAVAGLEFTPGGGVSGGVFLGAMAARGTVGESQDTTQRGGVVGGHAGFAQDGHFADFYAALGVLQIDSERSVADNTVDGGLALASASQAGYFISPAVTIGADLEAGAGILTPSLRLRYTALSLDGYSESGAADAVVVDDRLVHELELRAQLALALTPRVTEDGTLSAVRTARRC